MREDLTKLPRIASKAPGKNSIEWEIANKAKFVYLIIDKLGHTSMVSVKKERAKWWNKKWDTFMTHEKDAMTAIAKGLDFLEKYGYTLDNSKLSFQEKMVLGLQTMKDLKK